MKRGELGIFVFATLALSLIFIVSSSVSFVSATHNATHTNSTNSTNQTHLACVNFACVQVSGAGANLCTSNAQCQSNSTNNSNVNLVPMDPYVSAQWTGVGDNYELTYSTTVNNYGSSSASGNLRVSFSSDFGIEGPLYSVNLDSFNGPSPLPHYYLYNSGISSVSMDQGVKTATLRVDPNNYFAETNENDNIVNVTFLVNRTLGNSTHLACISNTCTRINGAGANECSSVGVACGNQNQTHTECQTINSTRRCVIVPGNGTAQCRNDAGCQTGPIKSGNTGRESSAGVQYSPPSGLFGKLICFFSSKC